MILEPTKFDPGLIVIFIVVGVVVAGFVASAGMPDPSINPDKDDESKQQTNDPKAIDLVHRVEIPFKLKLAIGVCVGILICSLIGYFVISYYLGTFLWNFCWAPFGFSRFRQFERIIRDMASPPIGLVECIKWSHVAKVAEFGAEFVEFRNFEGKLFQLPVEFFMRDHTFQLYLVGDDLHDFIYNLTEEQMSIFANKTLCYDIWRIVALAARRTNDFLPEGSDELLDILEMVEVWLQLNDYEAANFVERVFLPRFTLRVVEFGIIECLTVVLNSTFA